MSNPPATRRGPRVISNSGGRTSAWMTLLEMEHGLGPEEYVIFCNTGKEREETLQFLHRQQTILGVPIIWLEYCRWNRWKQVSYETASRKGEPFEAIIADHRHWKWRPEITRTQLLADGKPVERGSTLWQHYYEGAELTINTEFFGGIYQAATPTFKELHTTSANPNPFGLYLPNVVTRFCTQELKIRVMRDYMRSQGHGHWTNVVGIRADEPSRHANGRASTDSRFDVEHPLFKAGITKPDVLAFWKTQPFDLELLDHEGNCDLCFMKGKGKRLDLIRRNPEEAQWWIDAEAAAGVTFSKRESYTQLVQQVQRQPSLDFLTTYDEPTIGCFCGD